MILEDIKCKKMILQIKKEKSFWMIFKDSQKIKKDKEIMLEN